MLVLMVLGAVHQNLLQANQGHSQDSWRGSCLISGVWGEAAVGVQGLWGAPPQAERFWGKGQEKWHFIDFPA